MQTAALRCCVALALGVVTPACGPVAGSGTSLSELNGRSVHEPTRFGVLSSERETEALPSAVSLGAKTSGRTLLYFEFQQPDETRRLLRAQLLLSSTGPAERVEIEVSRSEAANGELRAWSDQPRALYPRLSAELGRHAGPERVDVTRILQSGSKRGEPLCILLRAEPGEGEGVLIATGVSGGETPRLELYWQ